MKKFILKAIWFILLLAGVDFTAGNLYRMADGSTAGTQGKARHLANGFSEDILVLGSSRAAHHFNSNIIADSAGLSCYNGAFNGNGIILAYAMARMAADSHVPEIIIYEFTPDFDILEGDNLSFIAPLKPYYSNPHVKEIISELSPLEAFKLRSNLYRLNSDIFSIISAPFRPDDTLGGYVPLYGTTPFRPGDPQLSTPEREQEWKSYYESRTDSVKLRYMERLIDLCRDRDICLVFTISPVHDNPYRAYNLIGKVTGDTIPVLNHLNDSAFVGHRRYFHDRTHLNTLGADSLSAVVAREIFSCDYKKN